MSAGLCPTCLRRYAEGTASFCKADGTALLPIDEARGGGATWDRSPMARPGSPERRPVFDPGPAASGPLSTIRGVVPPGLATAPPPDVSRTRELVRIALLLLVAAAAGGALFLWLD